MLFISCKCFLHFFSSVCSAVSSLSVLSFFFFSFIFFCLISHRYPHPFLFFSSFKSFPSCTLFFFLSFFFSLLVDGQVSISLSKVFEGGGKTFPVFFMFSSTFFFYFFFFC